MECLIKKKTKSKKQKTVKLQKSLSFRLCLSQISIVKFYFSLMTTENRNLRETTVFLLLSAVS